MSAEHQEISEIQGERPRYPNQLVERYGAKAGLLIYVARELPDIPQMPMVVSEPGETNRSLLRRADKAGISWPRFFRSSAVAELDGYEGDFPTEEVGKYESGHERARFNPNYYGPFRDREYFNRHVNDLIDKIRTSPKEFKTVGRGMDLPDEINVIIAESSPSQEFGTYIKHPNRENYYLMALTQSGTQSFSGATDNPQRNDYEYSPENGATPLDHYHGFGLEDSEEIRAGLDTVAQWHDRIASLPDMDSSWTYQIEFGINPPCLYQVRPFKQISKADFRIEHEEDFGQKRITIGITLQEGLPVRVEADDLLRRAYDGEINPDNQPSLLYGELRSAGGLSDYVPNHRASVLHHAAGMLQHGDIKDMRSADVTILFPLIHVPQLRQGEWVNITSDGYNSRIQSLGSNP